MTEREHTGEATVLDTGVPYIPRSHVRLWTWTPNAVPRRRMGAWRGSGTPEHNTSAPYIPRPYIRQVTRALNAVLRRRMGSRRDRGAPGVVVIYDDSVRRNTQRNIRGGAEQPAIREEHLTPHHANGTRINPIRGTSLDTGDCPLPRGGASVHRTTGARAHVLRSSGAGLRGAVGTYGPAMAGAQGGRPNLPRSRNRTKEHTPASGAAPPHPNDGEPRTHEGAETAGSDVDRPSAAEGPLGLKKTSRQ